MVNSLTSTLLENSGIFLYPSTDIVFAVLPFCQLSPALDASTLATILRQDGLSTKVIYLNRHYAALVDRRFYDAAAAKISLNSLLGDWVFSDHVFEQVDDRAYLKSLLDRGYISTDLIPLAIHAKANAAKFLNICLSAIDWKNTKVLCLVETFAKRDAVSGQMMASLALAKKLKSCFPHLQIILSGPGTEESMGEALLDLPFLDFICTGNIYISLPRLIRDLAQGNIPHISTHIATKKILRKSEEHSVLQNSNLRLPIPDFDDYFDLKGDGLPGCFESIPMETSKGCWWAELSHCLFCALPGSQVKYQSKTPEDVLLEFQMLVERYQPRHIEMNDLIIDKSYFSEVFPKLGKLNHGIEIFFETKAYLKREQLQLLVDAGVTKIQAGIESLSSTTLKRIGKGVSASTNARFLKDCSEVGIDCYWNYLHSFPGESALDILAALPVIQSVAHLQAPSTFQPVRVERFSPYFQNPKEYGIQSIQPDQSYFLIYQGAKIDLQKFAFYFEHKEPYIDQLQRQTAIRQVRKAVENWALKSSKTKKIIITF
jgi:ribosomal peptide maturation radical SAM protein 1